MKINSSTKTKNLLRRDFTSGRLFLPLLYFAIPIMLSGMLQTLYSIADNVIVGRFSSDPFALAAVGSTGSLSALIINLIIGVSAGSSVVIAQMHGARQESLVNRAVHTSLLFALIGGVIMMTLGLAICRPALSLIGTKPELLDSATLYMSIIFIGVPGSALYNFGSTALRATGDSKTPLVILGTSGLINVLLNLFFVIVCNMTVDGVALATIISQYLSAIAVIIVLHRRTDSIAFRFSKLRIDVSILRRILRLGLPAGVQSSLFALSNVLIQSSVNTFSTPEIAGNTASANIEAFTYVAISSFHHAAVTVTGQNYGAARPDRIKKTFFYCILQCTMVHLILCAVQFPFFEQISYLFVNPDTESAELVVLATVRRLNILLIPYILCGIMDVISGTLRGIGMSVFPMCASLFGACAFRIFWSRVIFFLEPFNSPEGLYISYPISWILVCLIDLPCLIIGIKKMSANKRRSEDVKQELQSK